MSAPTSGYYVGGEHQPERFTSSPHPVSPTTAHTPASSIPVATHVEASPIQTATAIPVLAQQTYTHPTTVPASVSIPGPITATPILPSSSPSPPIIAPTHVQRNFHDSGPATAGSGFPGPSRKPTQESIQESAREYEDDAGQSHGNVPAQAQTQARGYEHSSAPVAGPSGQTNAVIRTESQRTTSTPPQEHPNYGPPPARGSTVHTNVGDNGNAAGVGAGFSTGAGNGYNTPAAGSRQGQRGQSASPGRRTSSRTVSYTDPLPSRAADRYPLPMTTPHPNPNPNPNPHPNSGQPVPSVGVAKSLPMPPLAHHGTGSGDLVMSPQPDATAMHRSELDWAVPYMPGSNQPGPGNGMGMQGMPGGVGVASAVRPGSRHDSRRASAYTANGGGNGNGPPGAHRRSMSMAGTLVTGSGERSVDQRLRPTLDAAQRELVSARRAGAYFRTFGRGWVLRCELVLIRFARRIDTGQRRCMHGR